MYDYDRELVLEILSQIKNSLETILYRFEPIERIEDFTDSPWGMEKLDSICMQLIVGSPPSTAKTTLMGNELRSTASRYIGSSRVKGSGLHI